MKPISFLALAALALASSACSSGGGDAGPPQLNAGVDLSGAWSIDLFPTSVGGTCPGMVPGSRRPGVTQLAHDLVTNALTVDVHDPQGAFTSTLTGASLAYEETFTDPTSGDVSTFTLSLIFSPDGGSVSGSGRERTVDAGGGLVCDFAFDVRGEPFGGELMFLLDWSSDDDLDLESREPDGTLIYWGFQTSQGPSGGRHTGDSNRRCMENMIAAEAVTHATPQPGAFSARAYESFHTTCNANLVECTLTTVEPGSAVPTVMHGFVTSRNGLTHQVIIP